MFINPQDEERICHVLRAYVEEWGPENVTVALPTEWENPNYSLGPTKLEFTTQSTISVRVEFDNVPRLNYQVELAA